MPVAEGSQPVLEGSGTINGCCWSLRLRHFSAALLAVGTMRDGGTVGADSRGALGVVDTAVAEVRHSRQLGACGWWSSVVGSVVAVSRGWTAPVWKAGAAVYRYAVAPDGSGRWDRR